MRMEFDGPSDARGAISRGQERSRRIIPSLAASRSFRFRYHRLVGRFHLLRRVIAAMRGLGDRWAGRSPTDGAAGDTASWLSDLRAKGVSAGPGLGDDVVSAICAYARTQPCCRPGGTERFVIADVIDGRTPGGAPVAVADVEAPLACPDVARISQDPLLTETAARFLGYRPRRTRVRLYWSPVSSLPDDERRANGQTVDFHYDIDACNSFYVYCYIVGGGPCSGAHVTIEGSHGPKPLRIIADSCFQPEQELVERYGRNKVAVIAGGPGFCFFEDPACFHKALAPTGSPRLCLQIRYS